MSLTSYLTEGLLPEQEKKKVVAVYGGGFKPPTSGHFKVVKQALKENPEIDEFIILIGGKERDGISPEESLLIWDIYKQYLPIKIKIELSPKPPIQAIYNYAKEHPDEEVLWVIGAREGNEDDFKDISKRTTSLDKYNNLELRVVVTQGGVSGTAARNASKISQEKLAPMLPSELSDEEVEQVYNIVADKIQEVLTENASYSQHIDVQDKIAQLTQHMIDKGMNIEPLPTLEFVDGDSKNASDFFGKTAYYDPNRQHIVLYTEGRHPKDIVRSYAHEMIHHIQYLEDRLGDVAGTNTTEDDHLDKIEQEANLRGTMTFRNWTDSILNENTSLSFPNSALLFGGFFTGIQRMGIGKTIISDLFKSNPKLDNLLLYTQDDAIGFWKKLGGKIIQQGEDKKGTLRYFVQINKNDVDTNLNLKQLGISYKNLSTKKSKIAKGEYAIKMGRQKIGFFFVRDIGTIQMDPMNIFANNLNEAIVGEKIECDKCGWSWNIVDGGDDLFICHKCGHDNEPISEKKNKDPFGLNAYARELALLREEEDKYKIYLDMDGVIADFNTRFKDLSGIEPREFESKYGRKAFWDFIDEKNKIKFWVGIPPMPGASELVSYISKHDYEILTAPSIKDQSRLGKNLWVRNHVGDIFPSKPKVTFKFSKEKHKVKQNLSQFDILIDDRQSIIDNWNNAGGFGILYQSTSQAIADLKKLGL